MMNDLLLIFIELGNYQCNIQIRISTIAKREVISSSQDFNAMVEVVGTLSYIIKKLTKLSVIKCKESSLQ
jgi:hypothetical protein